MVETQQHQEPIRHAQEAADEAILLADNAVQRLHEALNHADPQHIQAAQDAIGHALNQVIDAREQLQAYNNESYGQQIKQTLQQLDQSLQVLESDDNQYQFPKQVR
jgi:flagellin-specific chaperone FliS